MTDMPSLHARLQIVAAARLELGEAVNTIIGKHDLTYPELLMILGEVLVTWARYALRDERNADSPDKDDEEEGA